jgi:hypothetical protein
MPPSKNVSLLRALVFEAESLASKVAKNEFPILLRPVAERRKVTSVDFRPLLVDAMLTTHSVGFRIILNSDGGRTKELTERYNNESSARMLPPRLRFSIAHELAHTFFYDITKTSPKLAKKFTSGGGRNELENLERYCNTIASHLLLPTQIFTVEFLRLKAVTPETISDFARKAGVSVQALLWRLDKSNSLFIKRYFRGCIVLVDQYKAGIKIRAIAKPRSLNVARQLSLMRSGQSWNLKASDGSEINPAARPPASFATLDIETAMSKSQQRYKIRFADVGNFDGVKSFLATFEES